ncbi:hypothetical protein ACFX2G_041998 [Malus domestica]|uniref:lysine-specific demethylase ELF6-like n=1 Tax=Malus domestica TaxID=3750 RepID=UPI003976D62A
MGDFERPSWLEGLPLAPVFRPTHTEFADPIAYISKIEKEASGFGICKIIPPLPKPSKRYVFSNLNKSLLKCPELGSDVNYLEGCSPMSTGSGDGGNDGEARAVFTTRHQELGQSVKKVKGAVVQNPPSGVDKQVWQSGEIYTLEQFETKSRAFARSMLGSIKEVTPLVIEEMFWKAASEKPIYIEYANDVPGSAFEEPVGQFRSSHRRRRKRNSYQRRNEISDSKKGEIISISERNSHIEEVKNATHMNVSDTCSEASKSSTAPEILSADETPQSSRQKNPNSCCDMEGTAGWKLSNSPWNLQVIARSPGSLTRFMPDDIPGVTSPMVYIGMLFSWFAWHVEDHELHSMNFLHTGSSKTWYSVPGDYAFDFEELIRTEAFGSNLDRLAALSLLGNKTTLISPEAVVAAGIPCCRLIQNSGEFVVTFPRAYHVGFSHGFNCGEAANFGTPQWLKVAKEAAVRRAAMNYLPMLSHQQLLYLLTMSFVSRVPRSLLPGVRSSRRRDRQKEEKEFSVKKAFIEDILKENNVLSVLLGKESSYHAVLWNHDLLPYTSKDSVTPSGGAAVDMNPKEDATHIQCGNYDNDQKMLIDEMSLYMENMNDLYLGSDDLSRDFQVDSGTLACVACGILGFPFMSVVQPSEKASMKLQTENFTAQGSPGISGLEKSHSFPDCHASVMGCVTEEDLVSVPNFFPPAKDPLIPSTDNLKRGWNTVNKFLRPRSFCLEHAVEIVDLLQCKGGANMLVICHSDYQKIKAPAAAIAEEIGCSFNYNEVPLDNASQEDLNLIELAVDDERDECGEDWTSKLGINLRYCVKVRKNSSSKQVRHALTLGGLFSKQSPNSNFLAVKWQSRRSRSKKLNHPVDCKPCENIEEKDEVVCGRSDGASFKREEKIIQYSRRKSKLKVGSSTGAGRVCGHPGTGVEGGKDSRMASESNICNNGNSTSSCARFDSSASSGMSEMYPVVQMSEATRDISLYSTPSQVVDTLTTAMLIAGSVEAQVDNHSFEERNMNGEGCKFASRNISDVQDEMRILEEASQRKSATPPVIAADETVPMQIEEQKMEKINNTSDNCNLVSEGQSQVMAGVSVLAETTNLCAADSFVTSSEPQMVNTVLEKSCISNEVCDSMTSDDEVQQEIETTNRSKNKAPFPCGSHNAEDSNDDVSLVFKLEEEIKTPKGENEEPSLSPRRQLIEPSPVSVEGTSGASRELCAAADFCPGPISHSEEFLTADRSGGGHVSTSLTQMEIIQPCISVEESSEVPRGGSSVEGTDDGVTSDTVVQQEVQTTNGAIEAPILSLIIEREMQPTPRLVEEFEVPIVTCETINISGSMALDEGWKNRTTNGIEELIPSRDTSKCQPSPSIQTYSRAKRKPHAAPDLRNGGKVCSSLHDKEMENIGSSSAVAPSPEMRRKRKRELEQIIDVNLEFNGFIRGPCEGLRPRAGKDATSTSGMDNIQEEVEEKPVTKKVKKPSDVPVPPKKQHARKSHRCDIESCRMRFAAKAELMLHKRNRCPHEGCGKRFSSHKYAVSHSRVHDDDRPLKCPWKGCSMSFKWAWARTEHIRVHTGERPYQCKVEGCGLFFRFVSDYSRHRRKTGHYVS